MQYAQGWVIHWFVVDMSVGLGEFMFYMYLILNFIYLNVIVQIIRLLQYHEVALKGMGKSDIYLTTTKYTKVQIACILIGMSMIFNLLSFLKNEVAHGITILPNEK